MLWYCSFWLQRWCFWCFLMARFINQPSSRAAASFSASAWRRYLDHRSYELDADVRDQRRTASGWILWTMSLSYTPFKSLRLAKIVPLAMVLHRNSGILFTLLGPNVISYPPFGITWTNRQFHAKLRYPSAVFISLTHAIISWTYHEYHQCSL